MTNVTRLPGPIADIWDWQRNGSCRGRDSAQFFHPDGERGSSRTRREAGAKAVCRACPVRAECAAHALKVREPYGVWGGFSEAERLRLLALGWEDVYDRRTYRVDVVRLEERLGLRPLSAPAEDGTAVRRTPGVEKVPTTAVKRASAASPRTAPAAAHGAGPRLRTVTPPHTTANHRAAAAHARQEPVRRVS